MKKTLLIAAAALAAGVISTQAQPVYSQNIVGYYNVTVPAGKQALIGNQLLNVDGTNGFNNVLANGNFVSQSTTLYLWNNVTFIPFTYYSAADAAPFPAGFYDGDGNPPATNFKQGISAFLSNPSASSITITFVGDVVQGAFTNTIPVGYSPLSAVQPVSTNIASSVIGLTLDTASQNATYYHWNVSLQHYDAPLTYYSAADASPSPAGWYDGDGNSQPWSSPSVGDGFFINNSSGSPVQWIGSLSVQ